MQPSPRTINKLSIIIPCFNEEQYVVNVLQRVKEVNLDFDLQKEIIIVNDGSVDGTPFEN
jgi:glycosyltransferase involved in cell wall biosynthesis